jgi:hypothetical protein
MKKLPYKEGDIFAVPLKGGGYGWGVVARHSPGGKIVLGYFFGGPTTEVPQESAIPNLRPEDALLVVRFGDLSLYRGDWKIVGGVSPWNRQQWPIPSFKIEDPLLGEQVWKVRYFPDDPARELGRERLATEETLETAALWGAGAVEIALSKLAGARLTN